MTEPTHILVDILEKYARQQPEKNMLHARIDGQWIGQTARDQRACKTDGRFFATIRGRQRTTR